MASHRMAAATAAVALLASSADAVAQVPRLPLLPNTIERIDGASPAAFTRATSHGDVNGDGLEDLVVTSAGHTFLVFGVQPPEDVNLRALGERGFEIDMDLGSAVDDMNGDGRDEVVVGQVGGPSYVVFGRAATTPVEVDDLGSGGFGIFGAGLPEPAGDVNGDGRGDVIVRNDEFAYVVFGKASTAPVDLEALGAGGFSIRTNNPFLSATRSVHAAGDVNGDGRDDLVMGPSFFQFGEFGPGHVIFGKASADPVDPDDLGDGGFAIAGVRQSNAGIGDFNGDGFDDILTASIPETFDPGRSAIVFGKAGTDPVDVRALGDEGIELVPSVRFAPAGDVNGDGLADVVIAHRSLNPRFLAPGPFYVVFGTRSREPLDLRHLGLGGVRITAPEDLSPDVNAPFVAPAGDVDGDGRDDLAISDIDTTVDGAGQAGSVFVVRIPAGFPSCTRTGTAGNEILNGTAGDDILCGLGGNDRLLGRAGDDVLLGAGGNDRLDGGAGVDTVDGEEGDDIVSGGFGDDWVLGRSGRDLLQGVNGDDLLRAGAGGDRIFAGLGADRALGEGGADIIDGGTGGDRLEGGDDGDIVRGRDGGDSISGGDGDDLLRGDAHDDSVSGDAGDDIAYGDTGADSLDGGTGSDRLLGGPAVDTIFAQDGEVDDIACGRNGALVFADPIDVLAADCG